MIFPLLLSCYLSHGGGGRGRGHSSQALAFLLSLTDKNDKNKAPLSLSGKIRVYSRSKSSFFKNLQAVNH